MRRAARLYQDDPSDPDLPKVVFALDSSIISLSLNLFPWGYYARTRQAALKLHLLLSLQGNLPAWAAITEANFADMKMPDHIPVAPGPIMSWTAAIWILSASSTCTKPVPFLWCVTNTTSIPGHRLWARG